jgi:hypothetical protein
VTCPPEGTQNNQAPSTSSRIALVPKDALP